MAAGIAALFGMLLIEYYNSLKRPRQRWKRITAAMCAFPLRVLCGAMANAQTTVCNEGYSGSKLSTSSILLHSGKLSETKGLLTKSAGEAWPGLVLLITIIILLLISLYISKQKANRKLEANRKELDQKNTFLEKANNDKDKLLKEKEWLLKELHHRVKNNLQMVTSLLYSQSVYLEDDAAKRAVNDSLRRMQAMSLIHQKLYQDQNTSVIAMPEYINDLVQYLYESFDAQNKIIFEQHIAELHLDVSQAIPLGLIVTESIVNALKYAFLNEQRGVVKIILQDSGTGHLQLKISDNGVGLPAGFDIMEHNSLGLGLMQGLAKQLNGELHIKTDNGVHITLKFKTLSN